MSFRGTQRRAVSGGVNRSELAGVRSDRVPGIPASSESDRG
jgi:hypothetical protein